MRDDLFFFLGILILLFVVWVGTGGPSRPISFSGPYLHGITRTGTSAEAYGDPSKFSAINSTVSAGPGGVGVTNGNSALRGKVTLSRDTSGARSSDPDEEYLILNVSASGGSVSTAGWKLVSRESGAGAVFPQGAEIPRSGRVNALAAITLDPGDQAIIVTGRSPAGVSFRENECTGYLEENQDFHPALSLSCPTPSEELSRFYSRADDECRSYVRSISYCSTETRSSAEVSSACEDFIEEHLDYNGCVQNHEKDAGFASSVWRIFLGQRDELWARDGETIVLLDAQGKLVDSLSY